MLLVSGKEVPETVAELVNPPSHCAVVVVDLQNDFCHPDGAFGRFGSDTSAYLNVIEPTNRLLQVAERVGALVVFLLNSSLAGGASESAAQLRLAWRARPIGAEYLFPFEYTVEGTWGEQLLDSLYRPATAVVIRKPRSSGFAASPLDTVLRSNGIRTVIVAGCTTEGCVDSTARDAGFLDYFAVIAADCVASADLELHEAALKVLGAYRADVVAAGEIIGAWGDPAVA
jgi:nicotinamidase-related amidase